MSIDYFYLIKSCERCGMDFSANVKRVQSWFTDEVICSTTCSQEERSILSRLGAKKYEYEDCGFVPYPQTPLTQESKSL